MNEINKENRQSAAVDAAAKKKTGTSGLSVAGMVVGILAIIGSWIPLLNLASAWIAVIAIGLSVAGLIVSIKGTKGGKGFAIAGLVLGAVTIILVIVMYVSAGAASDNSANDPAATGGSTQTESSETGDPGVLEGEGDLGDYHIKIGKSKMTANYNGEPAIIVNYVFTNNSDKAISFDVALSAKAFQNGVELDSDYFNDEDESYLKDVKPGVSFDVKRVYVLDDDSADVEVEVGELISFSDDKVVKTFSVK